jgi:hypothetical protein
VSQDSITARGSPGRWFLAARFLILAQILATVIATILNLPSAYRNLLHLEPTLAFQGWGQAQLQSAVQAAGIAPGSLATLLFLASLFCLLSFWAVAALLAWRKSDSWIGLLIIYILASIAPGFSFLAPNINLAATDFLGIYHKISVSLIWPTFYIMLYLFPAGRFIPRWTRFLAPLPYLAFSLPFWIDPKNPILNLLLWLIILYLLGGIASQLYRYRRMSAPTQRQQTKWVVFALGILVVSLVIQKGFLLLNPELSIGTSSRFWFDLIGNYLFGTLAVTLIPLAIGISILRYRLWDIDLIIRRTLLYALLSGLLGLVYFGSVVLLRQVLGGLTGNSSASLVLSTLLIAALFSPVRRRVQTFIDRRFYRQKFNAGLALKEFSSASQREVELTAMTGHLVRVVEQTVRPENVSLWLRKERK